MKITTLPVILLSLFSFSSAAQEVGNSNFSYGNVEFQNLSISTSAAPGKFTEDITSCKIEAQRQYEANSKNAKNLSSIYGQPITPDVLKSLSEASIVVCMAGDKRSGSVGKGWSVVQAPK